MEPETGVPETGPEKTRNKEDEHQVPVHQDSGDTPTSADGQRVSERCAHDSPLARSPSTPQFFEECEAIVTYMARRGDIWKENDDLRDAYSELVTRVIACKGRKADASEWKALALAYAEVTRFTYEMRSVNGRSVLDTWDADDVSEVPRYVPGSLKPLFVRHRRPLLWAVILSVVAIVLQVVAAGAERYYIRSCVSELGGVALLLHYAQLLTGWPQGMDACVTQAGVWIAFLYHYTANNIISVGQKTPLLGRRVSDKSTHLGRDSTTKSAATAAIAGLRAAIAKKSTRMRGSREAWAFPSRQRVGLRHRLSETGRSGGPP